MMPQKILIIDDEAFTADMSRMALGNIGHMVSCAYSGEQGIEMAMSTLFDLAIVSAMLPGMSGIETFELIRQSNPGIVGILVTGHADIDMVIDAMNKGFNGVLKKPVERTEIVNAVQEALTIASLREENTRLKTMLPLYKLGEKFVEAETSHEVYELLLEAVSLQINVPTISLMMFVKEDKLLHIVASRGIDETMAKTVAVKSGEKIAGWVYAHGEPVILNKHSQDKSPLAQYLKRKEISASISFPLTGRNEILGVLNISQTERDVEYSQGDLEMLSVICGQAVMALENVTSMKEREQNVRTKALFEQYVAPEVAEILLSSGEDLMNLGGVRELTVLFADIRNFTMAVQHLSHTEIHHFLTGFFDLFSEVAFSWQGTLDKFMGDAALVSFGAPIHLEDPSDAALCTALELAQKFEQLRKKWLKRADVFQQLGLGIGISRGELFHGNVGSSRRLDYTVIGTDVNIAQRLASSAESGVILITDSVERDLKQTYPVQTEDVRRLRGLEREIQLYSICQENMKRF
jgi:adenylate cyclase